MITFYFSPGSSSMATHIALNEAGASFEARPLALQKGTRMPDFLKVNPTPTEAEIREGLSSVICRCTGYRNIVRAVAAAAAKMRDTPSPSR